MPGRRRWAWPSAGGAAASCSPRRWRRGRRGDAGAIGFVGLVVPHALRLVGVRAAPLLLRPALSEAVPSSSSPTPSPARSSRPLQLPVGVLAAAVGVPTFIAMLLRRPSRSGHA
jgi:ABC-type enterobactin transport system permease subunit